MIWYEAAALMIGVSLLLMLLGLPVAFSFIATNLMGAFLFMGGARGLEQVASNMSASVSTFLLVPVPSAADLAGIAKGANPAGFRDRGDRF